MGAVSQGWEPLSRGFPEMRVKEGPASLSERIPPE